jgi:hypothetical protein
MSWKRIPRNRRQKPGRRLAKCPDDKERVAHPAIGNATAILDLKRRRERKPKNTTQGCVVKPQFNIQA